MPIRHELKRYYGAGWRAYRAKLIKIHGNRGAKCGREVLKYLNAAHITHDPRQSALVTLLCPACHNRHDARQRYAMTAGREIWLWLARYCICFGSRRAIHGRSDGRVRAFGMD